jgi:heme/copper-type cytochrome/quinol oxidase subunit 3
VPAALVRPDTGTSSTALGMWLFLASSTMFFGSLFSAYVMLRAGSLEWPKPFGLIPWLETGLLVAAAGAFGSTRIRLISAHALGLAFVAVKLLSDLTMIRKGLVPSATLQLACWFTLGAVHAVFVFGAAMFSGWMAGPAYHLRQSYGGRLGVKADDREGWLALIEATHRYWIFLALLWLIIVGGFYVV